MTKETYESSDTDPNRENEATILPPGERERSSGRSDGRASARGSLGEYLSSAAFLFPVRVVCTVSPETPDEHRSSQTRGGGKGGAG